jgi:hypothetical protein
MNPIVVPANARFPLGSLYITTPADATLVESDVAQAVIRHATGFWGDLSPEDMATNDAALHTGGRLLSAYHDSNGTKFWIITEADRSATTVLLPDDY